MQNKKMSLGRGLDSLFSENDVDLTEMEPQNGVQNIRISMIEPKIGQPRQNFPEAPLNELADSIRENGVIQPILVRKKENGYYEIIAGERRWRASRKLGRAEIPAIVLKADDLQAAQMALIENLQRENLNPFEEADAYRSLMDTYGLTQEEVASKVGKSRSAVANALRLRELPDEVMQLLLEGQLTSGHGKAILSLSSEYEMISLAKEAAEKNWSVRRTEEEAQRLSRKKRPMRVKPTNQTPNYLLDLERRATNISGRLVRVNEKKKTVTVDYQDNDDLIALLEQMCGQGLKEDIE